MRSPLTRLLCLALLMAFALRSAPAAAQSATHDAEAKAIFEAGKVAYHNGRYEDALARWQDAYRLSKRPQLHYNLGLALDRLRRDKEALAAFNRYLKANPDGVRVTEVRARVAALEQAIRQRAEKTRPQAQLSQPPPAPAPAPAPPPIEVAPEPASQPAPDAEAGARVWTWVAAGGAVAFTGSAVAFGLLTNREFDSAERFVEGCEPSCDETAVQQRLDDGQRMQLLTNVSIGLAAACLAAGVTAFVLEAPDDKRAVAVELGAGSLRLRGQF